MGELKFVQMVQVTWPIWPPYPYILKLILRCSSSGLIVSAWKWFRSFDKCGCRQLPLIFTVIASPLEPKRNFVKTLHMSSSQCLDVATRKWFWSVNKYGRTAAIFKIVNCPLFNTITISLSHLLRGHMSDFFKTCLRCSTSGLIVSAWKWFQSLDKYGCWQPSLIFTIIASPLKPLVKFCQNLAYEFLSLSRYVSSKIILVCQQIWPNNGHLRLRL